MRPFSVCSINVLFYQNWHWPSKPIKKVLGNLEDVFTGLMPFLLPTNSVKAVREIQSIEPVGKKSSTGLSLSWLQMQGTLTQLMHAECYRSNIYFTET